MIDYLYIGWCNEGKHDKVWIAIKLSTCYSDDLFFRHGKILTIWGRRGGKLRSKVVDDTPDIWSTMRKKRNKGYNDMSIEKLNLVYPEFAADLEKVYIFSKLSE